MYREGSGNGLAWCKFLSGLFCLPCNKYFENIKNHILLWVEIKSQRRQKYFTLWGRHSRGDNKNKYANWCRKTKKGFTCFDADYWLYLDLLQAGFSIECRKTSVCFVADWESQGKQVRDIRRDEEDDDTGSGIHCLPVHKGHDTGVVCAQHPFQQRNCPPHVFKKQKDTKSVG